MYDMHNSASIFLQLRSHSCQSSEDAGLLYICGSSERRAIELDNDLLGLHAEFRPCKLGGRKGQRNPRLLGGSSIKGRFPY